MADTVAASAPAPGEHKYQFNVSMSCGGCSGAVERVLKKLEGPSKQSSSSPYYPLLSFFFLPSHILITPLVRLGTR